PHVDHRADLYAVGALGYEMLTGRPPFTGPNPQAVLAAHITQAPASVSSHRQAVPAVLDELLLRLLAKRPADRPQRAAEVLPRLEGMLTPTGTRPMTIGNPTTSPPHPARTGLLFVLASAGVLAIAALLVRLLGLPDWV